MVDEAKKAQVTLGDVPLAGSEAIVWQFTAGVVPFSTTFTVHKSQWGRLAAQQGRDKPVTLSITDARNKTIEIKNLYILHQEEAPDPSKVSFRVADKRVWWPYELITKDYNMPRKTGDKSPTLRARNLPQLDQFKDEYDFLAYSLNKRRRWKAQDMLRDVLSILESSDKPGGGFRIEGFPLREGKAEGSLTVQGVSIRDNGDVAVSRLLSYIPGAQVTVNAEGLAVIYDETDLNGVDAYIKSLPVATYAGNVPAMIDRKWLQPDKIRVHYAREVEAVFDFRDDYGSSTTADPGRNNPFIENVIPTVDPNTLIQEWDPESGQRKFKTVPPGTWVNVKDILEAWDATRPEVSMPWTFDTIRIHWPLGSLEGVLIGKNRQEFRPDANIGARVQALKQHFRQTFRINRRYMGRVRELSAVRAALLDPVSGARAKATAWGQITILPTVKGQVLAARTQNKNDKKINTYYDYLYLHLEQNERLIDTPYGPAEVSVLDRDLGIFHVSWIESPYGKDRAIIPSLMVGYGSSGGGPNTAKAITRDFFKQDKEPMGMGMKAEGGTNGWAMANTMRLKVMMTIVPLAPNNKNQLHYEDVTAEELKEDFKKDGPRIQGGKGPTMNVFIPPGELTARFAWQQDNAAQTTIARLLGLNTDDPNKAGIEGVELPGFLLVNQTRGLRSHAKAVAAEIYAGLASSVQGTASTVLSGNEKLVGNMAGLAIRVSQAPSATVNVAHSFSGQPRRISRFALLPEAARQIILGTIPFKPEK